MATVTGIVRNEDGSPALGAVVRAFDIDLRSEQLLGEAVIEETSGRYVISYTAEQYRRAEKESADLVLRARMVSDGTELTAESDIHFNAGEEEHIDLVLRPVSQPPPERDLSELEALQEAIKPVLEGVKYRDFTDRDVEFLSHEATRQRLLPFLERMERHTLQQRLQFLRQTDQFADQTGILLAVFYGWFRILDNRLFELDELLDLPTVRLREALEEAIAENIIPDITAQIPAILERVHSLRFEHGRLVQHRFVVQLIGVFDDDTEEPLAGRLVDVADLDAEPEERSLGIVTADRRGIAALTFPIRADAPGDAARRLRLSINDDGTTVAEVEVEAHADQEEIAEVRVTMPEEDEPDDALDAFGIGEEAREALRADGLHSVVDVASISRAEFVNRYGDQVGDAGAYIEYEAARESSKMLYHVINTAWFETVTTPDDEPDDPDIPTDVHETLRQFRKCGCEDCTSAVSPAAYLAHLLQWTHDHIKDGQASIPLTALNVFVDAEGELRFGFGQPFADLPASCRAVEEQVRQVRICVEVLWGYTNFRELEDNQLPDPFLNAYRELRDRLYRLILTNLGTSFEQLRKATLEIEGESATAEQVAAQREAVASMLGVDEERLQDLFIDVEHPVISPSEDELQELFGYKSTRAEDVFASPGGADILRWQQERLEAVWREQDGAPDAYSGEERLPFVDPAVIDSSYLRTPLDENPAFDLLEERQTALVEHRQEMMAFDPQQNGLADLVDEVLDTSLGALRDLHETLQSTNMTDEAIEEVHEAIASLHLTPAGFSHLMEVDARLESGEPVGTTDEEIDSAWEAVFDVLSRAHRHSRFPLWVQEEEDLAIILGPTLFWFPLEPAAPPSLWQATAAERTAWEEALRRRSRRPLIDPDQISVGYITAFRILRPQLVQGVPLEQLLWMPGLRPVRLLIDRRQFIDGRLEALRAAGEDQPSAEARLEATLAASTLGIDFETFDELDALEESGGDLEARLAQLSLTLREYRFLADIHLLAQGAATVIEERWEEVRAILAAAEKRREYAAWRLEEAETDDEEAGPLTLHPLRFGIPKKPPTAEDSPANRWLHDPAALQEWLGTLRARNDQLEALEEALAQAVGEAEEVVLPLLRNVLMMQAFVPEHLTSLPERAEWLDRRLLIDTRMDGCHMTTRVSQAIETLQRLIRGIYTQEHIPEINWTLDAVEDYEAVWKVLGLYTTWRAFVLAYLYPENLLAVTPPSRQSYGFAQLKKNLPGRIGPADACAAADDYADYFRDVCHLEVQASCQVKTRVARDANSDCDGVASVLRSRVHLFALATTSRRVYTNSFDAHLDAEDTLDTWRPVSDLTNVLEIIGAVPHTTPKQQRLILLFVKVRKASKNRLMVVSFDLDQSSEWNKPDELDLPPGTRFDFSAVAVQKRHGGLAGSPDLVFGAPPPSGLADQKEVPTLLAIRAPDGTIYVRDLNTAATGWAGDEWVPLFGPLIAEDFAQVCALIQRSSHEYIMIIRRHDNHLQYRIFSVEPALRKDDGFWRSVGWAAEGKFAGAFVWPETPDVFVFYRVKGETKYAVIRSTADPASDERELVSTDEVNGWLRAVVGVDLESYNLDFTVEVTFVDWPKQETPPAGAVTFFDKTVDIRYVGNILHLLNLSEESWDWPLPELNEAEQSSLEKTPSEYRQWALAFVKAMGLDLFGQALKWSATVSFQHPELGRWKLAEWYIKQFTGGTGLANVLFNGATFPFRGVLPGRKVEDEFVPETEPLGKFTTDHLHFIPSGGDEFGPPTPRKAIALRTPDGAFRLKLRRLEDVLSAPRLTPVTPNVEVSLGFAQQYGEGPFELSPLSDRNDLELRRAEIRAFYEGLPKMTPPSVKRYLKEAYNLVPIHLGYELQRNGRYEEALLWYRQVFNYLAPAGERKIDYGLVKEEGLTLSYDNAEEWLDDTSNAHAIAATRKNTYTRHILLMIIRCLIDYADALFSRDNVTDNARARELYTTALRLLDFKVLKPGKSRCADIIGELEVEVVEPGQLPLKQFHAALAEIQDPDRLEDVVIRLRDISQDTDRDADERLEDMRDLVRAELEAIPAPKTMTAVLDDKRRAIRTLENSYLAHRPSRAVLQETHQLRRQRELSALAEVTDTSEEVLLRESPPLPWLRDPRSHGSGDGASERQRDLTLFNPNVSRRLVVLGHIRETLPLRSLTAIRPLSFAIPTGISFDFCIPQNPVVTALRRRAENNLLKLRTCRNIAGMMRQLDPYGAPIGIGRGMVSPDGTIFSGIVEKPPMLYRYAALIARAKELVSTAQQIEAGYQAALENAEREALSALQAEQNVELAAANVTLRDLRLNQANSELGLAQLQKDSAVLREETYAGWIAAGKNEHEEKMLDAYSDAAEAQKQAARASAAASVAQLHAQAASGWSIHKFGDVVTGSAVVQTAFLGAATAATLAGAVFQERAISAETRAQEASFEASFERRNDEWQLQQGLAALDVQIGDQQIQLARDGIAISQQERVIAGLEQTHAADVLEFLLNKDFTEEMYRWIASVLENVYRFFLQEAASIARLAERQLAFERQQAPLKVIQANYWNVPADSSGTILTGNNVDRLGLTGSARLLKDVYQLDNYAFETRRRKQALTITLDLAQKFPTEFQRFRETGTLVFETPQRLVDQQMPGYYLCLIQQVSVSVVALIPPTHGIRGRLTSAGTSRVVVGGDTFQTVTIRNQPERIALTAPTTTSGVIELEPDAPSLLRPFEGSGFDTLWELRMPKASNPFDYNTMATVLFTVELTALHSFDYERQVIEEMDRRVSTTRAFYFRQEFADPWYDLHNPDQTDTPMTVRFETRHEDFPPNLRDLRLQHVAMYFIQQRKMHEPISIDHLHFTAQGSDGAVGGGATSVNSIISTRRGNGTSWLPMIGQPPIGEWELALPNTPEVRDRFTNEEIEDILLVLTIGGETPAWPA